MAGLPNNVPLFRKEVLERRAEAVFGEVMLPQPGATTWLAGFAGLFFVLLVVLTFTVHIARHASATGWLVYVPGVANVTSSKVGIVTGVAVAEGQTVKAGDKLLTLSTSRSTGAGADVETRTVEHLGDVKESLRKRIALKQSLLANQSRQAEETVHASEREIPELTEVSQMADESVRLAKNDVARNQLLVEDHLISTAQLEDAKAKLLTIEATAKNAASRLRERSDSLKSQLSDLKTLPMRISIELAELNAQLASIDQSADETLGERETIVKSPIDGKVSTVLAVNGDSVAIGAKLMVIVPTGADLQAHILVPTRTSGFLDVGQPVRLRYDAFPYQKFGQHQGEIVAISRTVISANDQIGPVRIDEPAYLVTARIPSQEIDSYGKKFGLRGGLTLQAEISAESRTIAQWALDPLYASGRL